MAKRIVDGEALWLSGKLLAVQPPQYRPEYANLLPLAEADGCFECEPARVWSKVYSYNRPDVDVQTVEQMLTEFERVKMLFRWHDHDGKLWGHFVGIRNGRLPSPSKVEAKHWRVSGARMPEAELQKFLGIPLQPATAASPAARIKTEGARTMPEGFAPNESHRKLALSLGIDIAQVFPAFRDYHASKGSTFRDWDAALSSWMRREKQFPSKGSTMKSTAPADATQVFRAMLKAEGRA